MTDDQERIEQNHRLAGITVRVEPVDDGHEPICGCGWHGEVHATPEDADTEANSHYEAVGHPLWGLDG